MTAQDQIRVGMPLAEFLEANSEQPFELINGERIYQMPTVFQHSYIIKLLLLALHAFITPRNLGVVFNETTFVLPERADPDWVRGSRLPDVLFYAQARFADYVAANPDYMQRPLALVPDFVIEVISPTDRASDIEAKIIAYLQDGVRLLWVVYPDLRLVRVYKPEHSPRDMQGSGALDAGDLIPDWSITLDDLFGAPAA